MDGEVFYYAGGVLVLAALVISAIGIRNHEKFPPSRSVMAAVIGVFAALVIGATGTAVVLAREEQDHRRHELAEEQEHAAAEAEHAGDAQSPAESEAKPPPPGPAQEDVETGVPPGRGAQTELTVTSPEDGGLVFEPAELEAPAGSITLVYGNPSQVPHSIAIEAEGDTVDESETITDSETEASAELAPGEFVFYCTVPGHRESGMEGTLTVTGPAG
jgi:plastocyanin